MLTIKINKKEFLTGLSALQNITGKKGTIAILANILIKTENNSITLTGTDLEIGIKINIPAEIVSSGSITLPSKKLFEIVRESDTDQIYMEVLNNNWVKIIAKSTNYNLASMPSEDFPSFPEYNEDNLVNLSCNVIKELIDKTIYSIAQEGESQFTLKGALIEKEIKDEKNYIRMISSDGHRLSLMEREIDNDLNKLNLDKTTLIPRKGVYEIRKFCELYDSFYLGVEEKQAVIKTDNSVMIIRLMNGDFPNYKEIINIINKEKYIKIDRIDFLHSMKRMSLFTEDIINIVQFNFDKDKILLSSQHMDIGNVKDELKIEYSDMPFHLNFNGKYFIDTLQVINGKHVDVYISSEESPCLIKSDNDPGFISVIMPMKI